MQIQLYRSLVRPPWLVKGSFPDRNPNISYVLHPDGKNAHGILIDAGSGLETLLHDLTEKRFSLDTVLLTHTHHDHIFLLPELVKISPGLKIGVHKSALTHLVSRGYGNLLPLDEGMAVGTEEISLTVLHAPGHTTDSICFWDREGGNFFSGDVIFGGNIGCSDYSNGGNRNVFYQTIVRLLKLLPPHTSIYPGHYSEIRQVPPPYNLAEEEKENPYLTNALQGERGLFDRALKIFSADFEINDYVPLDEKDMDKIVTLEKEIWIPELQASHDTILTRLRHGHRLLGGVHEGELSGMIGWCYSEYSLSEGSEKFPRTFAQFSTCESCRSPKNNSAFIYNVGIAPSARGKGMGSRLLQRAFEEIRNGKISEVFLDSRLPSYNGSLHHAHETVPPNHLFRDAIDRYLNKNLFPGEEQFALDPAIRFYLKNGFKPWLIMRNFIEDAPSGNMRVICYLNLEADAEP